MLRRLFSFFDLVVFCPVVFVSGHVSTSMRCGAALWIRCRRAAFPRRFCHCDIRACRIRLDRSFSRRAPSETVKYAAGNGSSPARSPSEAGWRYRETPSTHPGFARKWPVSADLCRTERLATFSYFGSGIRSLWGVIGSGERVAAVEPTKG